jgi:uncharacterized protein (DUF58 family)
MGTFGKAGRGLIGCLTGRGRCFMAVGGAAVVCGLAIPEPDLVRVGALLIVVPMIGALTVLRSRGRLSAVRTLDPPRVAAGQPTEVTTRLENASRSRADALLVEDVAPYPLGANSRLVLDAIEPGGHRQLSYQIRSAVRGKFIVGPLQVRVADAFGLVEVTRVAGTTSTLVVTPRIFRLPRATVAGAWLGAGDGGMRLVSAVGEDDAAPRQYQDGDGLRRVHWKSTARYGELMVRHREHQRRNSASLFLDTRNCAHAGSEADSTFEFAVSAAASIGAHLSGEGFPPRLVTEAGEIALDDTLIETLAVITQSSTAGLRAGTSALAGAVGPLIVVAGRLSDDDARTLAAARRGNAPAMALLLAVSTWTADVIAEDTVRAAQILSAAGWRVAVASASTPLAAAWQEMHRPASPAWAVGLAGVAAPPGVR